MAEVIGIMGDRGTGKTCFLTCLLHTDYEEGRKIISNYRLEFPVINMSFEQVTGLPEELQNATLGFDELGIGADSREFFSKTNKKLAKLITQIRKRNCILFYTVQRLNLIDKRLRQQTDYFFLIEKTRITGHFLIHVMDYGGDIVNKMVFDGRPYFDLYDTNEIIDFGEGSEND